MPTCGSPWLFAAYRVLRRQSVPWHPPCALVRLILPVLMQTNCLLRLVGTVCSQSLFCLFLCSFQGAVKNLSILQNDTDYANHTSDSGPAAIYDLQNPPVLFEPFDFSSEVSLITANQVSFIRNYLDLGIRLQSSLSLFISGISP